MRLRPDAIFLFCGEDRKTVRPVGVREEPTWLLGGLWGGLWGGCGVGCGRTIGASEK
ncbi:hypothetical protein R6G71_07990 [Actinobaculum suis]|uniref:Uncharacterized protein n=1 Tax=Actinobaculum suis TaxID=1657 RepID=A0AAW9HML8_9ACTO|nr:hypothetical protein [Actinobaculum suis]MDY5153977.1 hypothetical protein [Actinobaculum suis]